MEIHNICGWKPSQSYLKLSSKLYSHVKPKQPPMPQWVLFNHTLAEELNLQTNDSALDEHLSILSGSKTSPFEYPIALAYAGHQFGQFTILGDGRAILLGEHSYANNQKVDVQLKGCGQTPYSRRGDGKATLRSMLREYIISEAINYLGIPTTRSLAVIKTGEEVYREYVHEGAVLTRIAKSHIRVGTFEYAVRYLPFEDYKNFADYVIERHYPEIIDSTNPYLELLKSVMLNQVDLVVNWMRVGFIHGVMNTDNMSISGETIDYGPCAFMNSYNPQTVFSSIDYYGRYAFGNQPAIAQWNLACLAGCLIPLVDKDSQKAYDLVTTVIQYFPSLFENRWFTMMGKKLGFTKVHEYEKKLILDFLNLLHTYEADYTNSFLYLMGFHVNGIEKLKKSMEFVEWINTWKELTFDPITNKPYNWELMHKMNPKIIPRNHRVEDALNEAENGNLSTLHQLLEAIKNPYGLLPEEYFTNPPPMGDKNYKTFCGT